MSEVKMANENNETVSPRFADWNAKIDKLERDKSVTQDLILAVKRDVNDKYPKMRGFAMVQTKLDEALMWLHHEAEADVIRAKKWEEQRRLGEWLKPEEQFEQSNGDSK